MGLPEAEKSIHGKDMPWGKTPLSWPGSLGTGQGCAPIQGEEAPPVPSVEQTAASEHNVLS